MNKLRYVVRPRVMPNKMVRWYIYDQQTHRSQSHTYASKRPAEKRADAMNAEFNKKRSVSYVEPAAPIRQYKD